MLAMASQPNGALNRDTELRHVLSRVPRVQSELCEILDTNNDWKKVMGRIRKETTSNSEFPVKYTNRDIRVIEGAAEMQRRSCTEIFLSEWSTSGRRRPTLKSLLELLEEAELFRAADFVADLLGEAHPARPANTPAERVDVSKVLREVEEQARNNLANVPSSIGEQVVEVQTPPRPQPVVSAESGVLPYTYSLLEKLTNNFNKDEIVETPTGRVKRQLGVGGFGSVFLAQLPNGTYVAVKKMHLEGAISILPDHFRNEVESISNIRHPNLLPLVGYSNDGPTSCLLYEYLDGGNLQDRLANEENPLPWSERIRIAECVAKGLEHLHTALEQPFIHRDVKTANILLSTSGDVKLCDFGLVRLVPSGDKFRTMITSKIVGSSPYMANEAFRGNISIKMDTFSFGVVLIELMTSLPAFDPNRKDEDLVTHFESNCGDSFGSLLDQTAGDWPLEIVESMFQIIKNCISDKQNRPDMAVVRRRISEII